MINNSSKYKKHILVCVKERPKGNPRGSCIEFGGMDIRTKFVQLINKHNLKGIVRASKSGCLDICEMGPNVVVYPQNIWYTGVTVEDVEEIFLFSVLKDEVVERLVATNVTWEKWSSLRADSTKKLKDSI